MTYQTVFERADDGTVFAYVPELPGCTSWGPTLDDARLNVSDAIDLWIATAKEQGIDVPPPSTSVKDGAA
jgi:predicted RNase H-like HicB family nuclease